MSQGKLSFRATKQKRPASAKNLASSLITNEKVESLKASDVLSPGSKRKHVSSPESSPSLTNPPRTGHSRVKRAEKRSRTATRATTRATACKTLFDYVKQDKEKSEQIESKKPTEKNVESYIEPVEKPVEEPAKPVEEPAKPAEEPENEGREKDQEAESSEKAAETVEKGTQNDPTDCGAKMLLKKIVQPREEPVKPAGKTYKTTGGRMLAAALAKRKAGVPSHKNEVIRALAARRELCPRGPKEGVLPAPTSSTSSSDSDAGKTKTPTKLSARDRFAHLLKPKSPKIKAFDTITISSPTKSPLKGQSERPGLSLPETHKHLQSKFNTSDQVVNLLARRQETCTFLKLQKNVQEICRKRFTELDLGHVMGLYQAAYILAQNKGLSQIKDDRTIRNEYQLTINFNYAETEHIKRSQTTNIFGLHPNMETNRKLDFEDDPFGNTKKAQEEKATLEMAKEKQAFNQRGLLSAELLERSRKFGSKMLQHVRAAHQTFLASLVPALKIPDEKLTRWHPEFDLNSLELPPPAELPKPPVSSRLLSATEMLTSIDSNRAAPPPGMQEAVERNLQKVIAEKNEQDRIKDDHLKDLNPGLVARIRAKEAKKAAQNMTRNPDKDKELGMVERLEPLVRCLRVLYVSAGKGSLLLQDVTQDMASNPRMTITQHSAEQHIRLLAKLCPTWLSIASLRKREYLKLNRNIDTNIVMDAIENKKNELMS